MGSRSRLQTANKLTDSPYVKYIPLLVIAIICFIWLFTIFLNTTPKESANFFIHQAYLPVLLPFYVATTFLFGYLTLNMKRGGIIGLFSTLLLLFRLQEISFAFWWLIPFFGIFIVLILISKKTHKTSKREKFSEKHPPSTTSQDSN